MQWQDSHSYMRHFKHFSRTHSPKIQGHIKPVQWATTQVLQPVNKANVKMISREDYVWKGSGTISWQEFSRMVRTLRLPEVPYHCITKTEKPEHACHVCSSKACFLLSHHLWMIHVKTFSGMLVSFAFVYFCKNNLNIICNCCYLFEYNI